MDRRTNQECPRGKEEGILPMTDFLEEMLKIQKQFQDKTGFDPLIHDLASAIMAEGGELWMGAGGKWWKTYLEHKGRWGSMSPEEAIKYIKEVESKNKENNEEEAIDILHFLLCVFIVLDMSSKRIHEKYCQKMGINLQRQDTTY